LYIVSCIHLMMEYHRLSLRYLKNLSTLYSTPSLSRAHLYHGPLSTITRGLLLHSFRAFSRSVIVFRQLLLYEASRARSSPESTSTADQTYTQTPLTHSLVSSTAIHLLGLEAIIILDEIILDS